MSVPTPSTTSHYESVQLLRFVAAMMVVVAHTTEAMALRIPAFRDIEFWAAGTRGVDIFFVISGFVMAVSSRPASTDWRTNLANAVDFFKRRLLRVVPLYWFYTLLKIASVLLLPALALRTTLDPAHALTSFLFIPWTSPWGLVQPVLPVGWTLSFEMLFYLIFAVAIALNYNRLLFCVLAFTMLYLAAGVFRDVVALEFYGHTLLFEFCIGMLLARLTHYRIRMPWALLMIGTGIVLLCTVAANIDRLFLQGLGSGLLVLGGIHLERNDTVRDLLKRLRVLGDISYSSYLFHSFLVPLSITLFAYATAPHPGLVIALTALLVVLGSLASYFWLERPMTSWLKRQLFQPPAAPTIPPTQAVPTQMGNL